MPDDTDPTSERRVTDDVGPIRAWADEAGAVPVRTARARGPSHEVALLPEDEARAGDHERISWPGFSDVLDDAGKLVTYDGSGDVDTLSVVDADEVDADELRYETGEGPGYEERTVEGTEYGEREMRGVGAPSAPAGEHRSDEGVREDRVDREESAAAALDLNDVGKPVVDAAGNEIGVVAQASQEGGQVYVDVDPGVTERIMSKLGWTGVEDVDYTVPPEHVRRVTDDRVVLEVGAEPHDEE